MDAYHWSTISSSYSNTLSGVMWLGSRSDTSIFILERRDFYRLIYPLEVSLLPGELSLIAYMVTVRMFCSRAASFSSSAYRFLYSSKNISTSSLSSSASSVSRGVKHYHIMMMSFLRNSFRLCCCSDINMKRISLIELESPVILS